MRIWAICLICLACIGCKTTSELTFNMVETKHHGMAPVYGVKVNLSR